jgi:hypothetical protein
LIIFFSIFLNLPHKMQFPPLPCAIVHIVGPECHGTSVANNGSSAGSIVTKSGTNISTTATAGTSTSVSSAASSSSCQSCATSSHFLHPWAMPNAHESHGIAASSTATAH